MKISRIVGYGVFAVVLIMPLGSALAQNVNFKLVDSGIFTSSSRGKGIEMRIVPEPMVDGLFDSPQIEKTMSAICQHYAPHVIPYIKSKFDIEQVEFLSVRIISGGKPLGQYIQEYYAVAGDGCGDPL